MLTIINGILKGTHITSPKSNEIRPTTAKTKKQILDIIHGHPHWLEKRDQGADICAGSGAMGFELLSDGFAHMTFVDIHTESIKALHRTINTLRIKKQTTVYKINALHLWKWHPMDLIFLDPPYTYTPDWLHNLWHHLLKIQWIDEHTLTVMEVAPKIQLSDIPYEMRQYETGHHTLLFIKKHFHS